MQAKTFPRRSGIKVFVSNKAEMIRRQQGCTCEEATVSRAAAITKPGIASTFAIKFPVSSGGQSTSSSENMTHSPPEAARPRLRACVEEGLSDQIALIFKPLRASFAMLAAIASRSCGGDWSITITSSGWRCWAAIVPKVLPNEPARL